MRLLNRQKEGDGKLWGINDRNAVGVVAGYLLMFMTIYAYLNAVSRILMHEDEKVSHRVCRSDDTMMSDVNMDAKIITDLATPTAV
ncbi:hypothetical protein CHS0354_002216 [Potamilus streckersoni]|uniref:Uncharacterized protein n=1 Tax=Potamilus streckersoni TaxID=2493646 RepID=A0AAE0VUA9_9BIVA|nr:hypothetical protein CHS0354_002216 [Potamilus streckersoni]